MNKISARATEYGFDADITFETADQLEAFIALFPKSVKVYATTTTTLSDSTIKPQASFGVRLTADAINGGVNETGIKRIRKYISVATANGYELEHVRCWGNSLSDADFDDLIGKVVA